MKFRRIQKLAPFLLLLAMMASGIGSAQASGLLQEVTPALSETPTAQPSETPTPLISETPTLQLSETPTATQDMTLTPTATPDGTPTPDSNALADASAIATSEWPQVARDASRSGYYPSSLGTNFNVTWRHAFQPEKIHPQVQAIVSGGRVFIGTEMGNLYALNATTGAQAWKFSAGGAILNSVAVDGGRVFFGAMDGAVYAVDAASGAQLWRTQVSEFQGFSTAPVIADGKVMLGGRNGIFYAFNPGNGSVLWSYDTGSAILQTAAWNGGKAYFGAMDMHVYAINSTNGALAWKSPRIEGMAFKDYWPVVLNGLVYVRPVSYGSLGFEMADYAKVTNASAQQQLLAAYQANPSAYSLSLFRLNESDGQFAPAVIHYAFQTMNGATAPPCVNRDGNLVMPTWLPVKNYFSGWGLLNPSSRVMVDAFVDGQLGGGNIDENMAVTCSSNLVLAMHIEEENANFTGFFNLDTRKWTRIAAGAANRQMANNTQGGGANPASVANGWVYHITFYELVARNTNQP